MFYLLIMMMVSITVKTSEARRTASKRQALSLSALHKQKATQVIRVVIGVALLNAATNVRNKRYFIIRKPTVTKISDIIKLQKYRHFSSFMYMQKIKEDTVIK